MQLTEKEWYDIAIYIAQEKSTIGHLQNKMRIGYSFANELLKKINEEQALEKELPALNKKSEEQLRNMNRAFAEKVRRQERKERTVRQWVEDKIKRFEPNYTYTYHRNIESFQEGEFRIEFEELDQASKFVLFRSKKRIGQLLWEEQEEIEKGS